MKSFSTLCALSLAVLIAAPLAARAADDCTADGHAQHQKTGQTDCGRHGEHQQARRTGSDEAHKERKEQTGDARGQTAAKRNTAQEQNAARPAAQQKADASGQARQAGKERPED